MVIPPELESSEKWPQLDMTEPAPPSPSSYLDLPPAPHVDNGKDVDPVLSYISHTLMEEDIVSNLYQYPDHPVLLTTEQPFAQILSDATSDVLATWPCNSPLQSSEYYSYCDMIASEVQLGMHKVAVEPNSLVPAESSSCCMDVISKAFFKGIEEANKLLPSKDSETLDRDRRRRKRLDGKGDVDLGIGRSSKHKAVQSQPESEEEAAARKKLDQLMLNDDPSHADMQDLLTSMEIEKARGRRGAGARHTVDLHTLLIRCAEAVATNDRHCAADLLQQIRHHSSPTGDGTQRLAHCFAEGLEARLAGAGRQLYQSLLAKCASATGILKVYQLYMVACSILPVRFLLSNKTTCNAVEGRKKLHVVQYGLGPGFQWPDLLRMLASREGGPPEVRLTSIDTPLLRGLIEETGRRLSNCARQFRVPFKFRAIAAKPEAVCAEDLDIDPDEVLVVISHYHFRTLMDENIVFDSPNPRDTVLNNNRKMRPKVFIHAVINGSYSGAFFVTRFREALNSFAALFDVMDSIVPWDNQNRLLVEQEFARCAMNIIACEGADRVERPHNYKQWQVRSKRAELRQLPLDPDIVQTIRDKVNKEYRKYIVINEDHGWLLMGWKGRVLSALSTWTADDDQ